uniref:Putative mrna cap guanine-n7 methyltransferase n=1 Tax=Ixodes ricinus TaxID=34613 RepID=A0A0K8RJY9_IXORI
MYCARMFIVIHLFRGKSGILICRIWPPGPALRFNSILFSIVLNSFLHRIQEKFFCRLVSYYTSLPFHLAMENRPRIQGHPQHLPS